MKKHVIIATLCLLVILMAGCAGNAGTGNYYKVFANERGTKSSGGADMSKIEKCRYVYSETVDESLEGTNRTVPGIEEVFTYAHSEKSNFKDLELDYYKNATGLEAAYTTGGELRKLYYLGTNNPIAVYGKPIVESEYAGWLKQTVARIFNIAIDDFDILFSTYFIDGDDSSGASEKREGFFTEDSSGGCAIKEYYVEFSKFSGKIRTDYVRLWSNPEGDIIGLVRFASEVPDGMIPEIDEIRLEKSLEKTVRTAYHGKNIKSITFDTYILGLCDDKVIVECGVTVSYGKDGEEFNDKVEFVIFPEE